MFENMLLDAFDQLTSTDTHILKFVIENKKQVQLMTLDELSEHVNYSKTTVHRCIQKLGFSGFSEFKFTLKNSLAQQAPTSHNEKSVEKIQKELLAEIEQTLQSIPIQKMYAFFNDLKHSRRVYGYGTGWKQEIAVRLFLNDLPSFDIYPSEIRSVPDFEIALKTIKTDDLVIIISLSGETKDIKHIIQQLYIKKVPVLAITTTKINYLSQHAKYAFSYHSIPDNTLSFGKPWSSITIHALLDYLLHNYQLYLETE